MQEFEDVCVKHNNDLGRTHLIKHRIKVTTDKPIHQKPYTITNPVKRKKLKEELDRMEKMGVIRKSYSPWVSPVTVVDKPDGTIRKCGDYRKLNDVTITHAYPIPIMNEELEKFKTAKYFTTMDAISGFWQVEMEEEDKEKTAFTTQYGLYEYNIIPFGLKNAPATFQKLMNKLLIEHIDEFVSVYIDDILIYSKTFEEHLQHLRKVFERLRYGKLKIKLRKCKFCEPEIKYFGHIVGRNGLKSDPAKISKILDILPPTK